MKKYNFGKRSTLRLNTVTFKLQQVVRDAMDLQVMDFTVLCGIRTIEEQKELFKQGRTRTMNSRHLGNRLGKSEAVDIAPYPINWNDIHAFHRLAGVIQACAARRGLNIRWGGDWDGDNDTHDQSFIDLPHFEISKK